MCFSTSSVLARVCYNKKRREYQTRYTLRIRFSESPVPGIQKLTNENARFKNSIVGMASSAANDSAILSENDRKTWYRTGVRIESVMTVKPYPHTLCTPISTSAKLAYTIYMYVQLKYLWFFFPWQTIHLQKLWMLISFSTAQYTLDCQSSMFTDLYRCYPWYLATLKLSNRALKWNLAVARFQGNTVHCTIPVLIRE